MTTHSEPTAAINTLQALGYTYCGGELWKPPIGQAPNFDLIDSLRARNSKLEAELVVEAGRTAQQKLRADQMSHQHDTQAALNREAREQLACLQAQQAVRGYDSGIQTGNRVTLIFNTQEDATRWFEGFTDAYDAAHGIKSIALHIQLAAAPTPHKQEQLLTFEPKKQELTAQSEEHKPQCWCTTCRPITLSDMRFVVCPECGNKRCPRAHNHELACTGSNAVGQPGSSWEHVKPVSQEKLG